MNNAKSKVTIIRTILVKNKYLKQMKKCSNKIVIYKIMYTKLRYRQKKTYKTKVKK